jgi:hypothetical protein
MVAAYFKPVNPILDMFIFYILDIERIKKFKMLVEGRFYALSVMALGHPSGFPRLQVATPLHFGQIFQLAIFKKKSIPAPGKKSPYVESLVLNGLDYFIFEVNGPFYGKRCPVGIRINLFAPSLVTHWHPIRK